jgi:hypothetical protein
MLTNGLSRGILDMTFEEDMDLDLRAGRLTLGSGAKLLHLMDILLGLPSTVASGDVKLSCLTKTITSSGFLFICGVWVFPATANFDKPRASSRAWFALFAAAPSIIYLVHFWYLFVSCSMRHRKFRIEQKSTLISATVRNHDGAPPRCRVFEVEIGWDWNRSLPILHHIMFPRRAPSTVNIKATNQSATDFNPSGYDIFQYDLADNNQKKLDREDNVIGDSDHELSVDERPGD